MRPETAESTWLYEFLAWLELNKKRVLVGAGAVLLLIVALYVYFWQRQQSELEASSALLTLKALAESEEDTPANAADFLKVAVAHRSTQAGERALLLAAGALYREGRYAEAQAQFEAFARAAGGSTLAPIAALGIAACLDAQDKVDAALGSYQGLVNQYPADPASARARLNMAALYEAKNQPEQALKLYDELTASASGMSGTSMDAMRRRQALLQKHPELAPTNAPPRVVASPPAATNAPPAATNASPTATTATNPPADTNAR